MSNTTLRYEPIRPVSREEALRQLQLGGRDAVNAIYSLALHDEDESFAEAICIDAIRSADPSLRYAAIGALGEMAYFAHRRINFRSAKVLLEEIRGRHPELSARIQDALYDIQFAQQRDSPTEDDK